jgi:hypothetical protein
MAYVAITFVSESADPKRRVRRAVVGRQLGDQGQVLAIDGSDPVSIVLYGGRIITIPAGSILKVEHDKVGPPPKRVAVPPKLAPQTPVGLNGGPRAVTFHSGLEEHTLAVGEMLDGKRVRALIQGDPTSVIMEDGSVGLEIAGGSISRWA